MPRISLLVLLLSLNAANAQQSYLVDWDTVGREAIDHLVELVKIPSVNPPGNETQVAEYIKAVLDAEASIRNSMRWIPTVRTWSLASRVMAASSRS